MSSADLQSAAPPTCSRQKVGLPWASRITNPRYGAAPRGRNQSSAEFYSAVSPICNRRAVRRNPPADPSEPSAEYNSAVQQITNLRYEKSSRRATTWTDTDRVHLCATLVAAQQHRVVSRISRYVVRLTAHTRIPFSFKIGRSNRFRF